MSTTITRKQIGLIHIAKKALNLSESAYRGILQDYGHVESSRDLDKQGFDTVMLRFYQLGFRSDWNQRHYGYRPGMASPHQVALMRSLWRDFTGGKGTDRSLDKWLEHTFKVASVRFLDTETAHKAIGALRNMTAKRAA